MDAIVTVHVLKSIAFDSIIRIIALDNRTAAKICHASAYGHFCRRNIWFSTKFSLLRGNEKI
jgi:hypothetical protein